MNFREENTHEDFPALDTRVSRAELPTLQQAFKTFSAASARLEAKYEQLLSETEDLRRKLDESQREIQRRERLAMLGETAAALAHEVRNPLGSMKLILSLLRQDVSEVAGAPELVEALDRSVNRMDGVISNILRFSRGQRLSMAPVNMHALLREELEHLNSESLEVRLSLEGSPFLCGNEDGLRQVIRNLATNAQQALRGKGKISLSVRGTEQEDLQLVFRDSGPGIAPEVLARAFEPFVTTRTEGTGLGLAVSRQVIEAHGGTIRVHNDAGAVFELRLPRAAAA
jgi:signal transduction histidine kinase